MTSVAAATAGTDRQAVAATALGVPGADCAPAPAAGAGAALLGEVGAPAAATLCGMRLLLLLPMVMLLLPAALRAAAAGAAANRAAIDVPPPAVHALFFGGAGSGAGLSAATEAELLLEAVLASATASSAVVTAPASAAATAAAAAPCWPRCAGPAAAAAGKHDAVGEVGDSSTEGELLASILALLFTTDAAAACEVACPGLLAHGASFTGGPAATDAFLGLITADDGAAFTSCCCCCCSGAGASVIADCD